MRVAFPLKCNLSTTSWPCRAHSVFVDWGDLHQTPVDTFVDLAGRVLCAPVLDHNSALPKLKLELGFKDMRQTVYFLGTHATLQYNKSDMLVIGGLCVK